jgi:hypothetical protein
MKKRRTHEETNIIRQSVLDHCNEPNTAKQLSEMLDVKYKNMVATINILTFYGFLKLTNGECSSHIGKEPKLYKTIVPVFDPSRVRKYVSKARSQAEPLSPAGRKIEFDSKYFMDLIKAQSAHIRSERKSSRTHVGISQIYNG